MTGPNRQNGFDNNQLDNKLSRVVRIRFAFVAQQPSPTRPSIVEKTKGKQKAKLKYIQQEMQGSTGAL